MDEVQKANNIKEVIEAILSGIKNDPLFYTSYLLMFAGIGILIQYKWRQMINNWYDGMPNYRTITILGGIFLITFGFLLGIFRILMGLKYSWM